MRVIFLSLLVLLAAAPCAVADRGVAESGVASAMAGLSAAGEPERLAAAAALRDAEPAALGPHAEALARFLEHEPSRLVREKIAWAIGNTGSAGGALLPRLITFYRRESELEVKRNLLRSFARIAPKEKAPAAPLVALLVSELPAPILGRDAVGLLGALGPAARPAVPALLAVLRGEDSSSRISAAISLGAILAAGERGETEGAAVEAAVEAAAVEALARSLGDLHLSVRQQAAEALGKIGPAAATAVPALIAALELQDGESADSALHGYAAWALGEMGKAALPAVPALRRCYESDPDPFTRKAAAATLRKLGALPLGKDADT